MSAGEPQPRRKPLMRYIDWIESLNLRHDIKLTLILLSFVAMLLGGFLLATFLISLAAFWPGTPF